MIEVHLMDIIWHGHSCFELVSGGYSAVIDPFQDTSVGTAYPHVRLTADAVSFEPWTLGLKVPCSAS